MTNSRVRVFRIPNELDRKVKARLDKGDYMTFTEFVRQAIRRELDA